MSTDQTDDEHQDTLRQHTQLLTELQTADACFMSSLHLYKGTWLYPEALLSVLLMQTHFTHQPTDIFLTSFLKTGTTWLRSLIFTTLTRSKFDLSDSDHPLLHNGPHDCFPVIDLFKPEDYRDADRDKDRSSPRFFPTHFACNLLPPSVTDGGSGCRIVYVCRDPKDVVVSLFHFMVNLRPAERPVVSFDELVDRFCDGVVEYGPYWDHVLGYWEASVRTPGKVLFLKYEDIKRDPEGHVRRLGEFMGVPFSAREEEDGLVEKIARFCSFEHLRGLEVNKTGTHRSNIGSVVANRVFFRRGEVGDWKGHMTDAMKERIDRITRERLQGSGLTLGATPE